MQKFRSGRYMYCVIHHVRCHVFTIHSLFTPGPAAPNERLPISLPLRIAGEQILRSLLEKEKTFSNLYFTPQKKKDLETFDLEDFKYNFVNISAFRIVDADTNFTRNLLRDMEKFQPIGQSILNKSNIIQVCFPGRVSLSPVALITSTSFVCSLRSIYRPSRLWSTTALWLWPTGWPPWTEVRPSGWPTSRAISSSRGMTDRRSSITSTR